jgi:RNA polymerase sigma-70 factor (ECF subfamily)
MAMDVDLNACVNGDKRAWDTFVDRFSGVIHAAVQRSCATTTRVIDRDELHDIVQDVFVRMIRNDYRLLRKFDPERASLVTWLTVIARSVAIDHFRRRHQERLPLDQMAEPVADAQPASSTRGDTDNALPDHLLTDRQRLVLHLLFERDLGVEGIANVLGVDAQTVRSTKHKALNKLREHFSTDQSELTEPRG